MKVQPAAENFAILQKNIQLNRCTNVETNDCAVSDGTGRSPVNIPTASDSCPFIGHGVTPTLAQLPISTVDKVVTCSNSVKKELFPNAPKGQVETIYYHADVSHEPHCLDATSDNAFRIPDACHLLIAGTVTESKGQEDAVRAVIELTKNRDVRVELVVVGYSDPEYPDYLQEMINTNEMEDFIHILPFQEDIFQIVESADIVLICSRMEAFGRVTLEAMLMEKAIVASNTGGTKEMIFDEMTGLLYSPGNHLELSDQIEALADNPLRRAELAAQALDYATRNFSREGYAGRYHELLMELKRQEFSPKKGIGAFLAEKMRNSRQIHQSRPQPQEALGHEQQAQTQQLEADLQQHQAVVQEQQRHIQQQDDHIQELSSLAQQRDSRIQALKDTIQQLEMDLDEVTQTKAWKLTQQYWQLRNKILRRLRGGL